MIDRFQEIEPNDTLSKYRIIVTGCGYSPLQSAYVDPFTQKYTHDPIFIEGQEQKLNIGAATAIVLALKGATVHMISSSAPKLSNLKKTIEDIVAARGFLKGPSVEYSSLDLFNESEVNAFVESISDDMPLYWVQSLGLGAGSYKLKDDNPYLRIEDIPVELLQRELSVTIATHIMLRKLLPRLRKQSRTKIVIVTSMSAIRYYPHGGAHCPAKAALDVYAKVADLELSKDNIFVTKIRPGIIDTGMYDSPTVQEINREISQYSGINIDEIGIRLAPPISVANLISAVLTNDAHIPSINLVAMGQESIEGS